MQPPNDMSHRDIRPARRHLPVILTAVLGIAGSLVLFWLVHGWEKMHQQMEFESRAKAYTNAVESTLHEYVGALLFLGDVYNNVASPVTRKEFTRLAESVLPRYPGIQALGWDPLVKDAERSDYEAAARQDGFTDFQFTERSAAKQLVRAARRPEYVIVYYIHPLETNRPALGFDIASNPTRLKAISHAFASGKLTTTGRITLVQETGSQFGVLLLLPIYQQGSLPETPEERQKGRKGLVVEVLRIGDAVEAAMKRFSDEGLSLTLYDASAEKETRLLYHRPTRRSETQTQPIAETETPTPLAWSKTFYFAERDWKLVIAASDVYYESRPMYQAWVVFFGSILLTVLLSFYILRRIRHTIDIERRVKQQDRTNRQLKQEIEERTNAEAERDNTIANLKMALDEVKTLRGILPLCSFCKKVRDDKGYWEQVDVYIRKYSQADISHSICPECEKKYYPDE